MIATSGVSRASPAGRRGLRHANCSNQSGRPAIRAPSAVVRSSTDRYDEIGRGSSSAGTAHGVRWRWVMGLISGDMATMVRDAEMIAARGEHGAEASRINAQILRLDRDNVGALT